MVVILKSFFETFLGKDPISHYLLLQSWRILVKLGVSDDLKGVVVENFPGGIPPHPQSSFLRSHRVLMSFVSDRPTRFFGLNVFLNSRIFRYISGIFKKQRMFSLSICNVGFVKLKPKLGLSVDPK